MQLGTNVVFSVSVAELGRNSLARALKVARVINSSLTLGGFRQCIERDVVVGEVQTYRDDMSEYLANLRAIVGSLKELASLFGKVDLLDSSDGQAITIQEIEEALAFHEQYQPNDLLRRAEAYLYPLVAANWRAHESAPLCLDHVVVADSPPKGELTLTYIQVGIQNQILAQLVDNHKYHHCCLHRYYEQLMPEIQRLVSSKLEGELAERFDDHSEPSGLVMLFCLERLFGEKVSTSISSEWTKWLMQGWIPCGWSGSYPDGRLIVW